MDPVTMESSLILETLFRFSAKKQLLIQPSKFLDIHIHPPIFKKFHDYGRSITKKKRFG